MELRALIPGDVPDLLPLAEQLGYPSSVEALARRLERLLASPIDGIFGAVEAGRVVGWVHVQERPLLEEDLAAEVCSLVVLDACRGQGVGRALMAHAEAWARARGLPDVFLRSNVVRKDTHRFYEGLGYTLAATSHLFTRAL